MENIFTPTSFSIKRKMMWWINQSSQEDKGGSFDLDLYLAYLEAQDDYLNPKTQDNDKQN
jgi:hypothetical protein